MVVDMLKPLALCICRSSEIRLHLAALSIHTMIRTVHTLPGHLGVPKNIIIANDILSRQIPIKDLRYTNPGVE